MKRIALALVFLGSVASAKPVVAPAKLKSGSLKAGAGITLSDTDRQAWMRSIQMTDGDKAQAANADKQKASATARLTKDQAAQDALWAKLKAAYPGLADGMLIDVRTGEASNP